MGVNPKPPFKIIFHKSDRFKKILVWILQFSKNFFDLDQLFSF